MLSVAEAFKIIVAQAAPLAKERVPLEAARNRVLAEDIIADMDLPPFDRAQMDGYALRASEAVRTPARLRIVGEAAAGAGWQGEVQLGEAVRIMTGAPVPAGADSVQKVEVTRELEDGRSVEIEEAVAVGQHIVKRASEVTAGTIVLRRGEEVTAAMVATLASFGYAEVSVAGRPRVAVLATGSELVAADEHPTEHQIRDSNSYSLAAYAELAGAKVERLPLAGDDVATLARTIEEAAARVDMLVLSGGVSMGVYDFTKPVLRELGAKIYFERVRLRPGKPTVFARLGRTLVFGLPGNPVSVCVTFNLFARTALRIMQGANAPTLTEQRGVLRRTVKRSPERTSYLPAVTRTDEQGRLTIEPVRWGGSSDFVAFAHATALLIVPEGNGVIEAESIVSFVLLPV